MLFVFISRTVSFSNNRQMLLCTFVNSIQCTAFAAMCEDRSQKTLNTSAFKYVTTLPTSLSIYHHPMRRYVTWACGPK
jgi:hypothetical protein